MVAALTLYEGGQCALFVIVLLRLIVISLGLLLA